MTASLIQIENMSKVARRLEGLSVTEAHRIKPVLGLMTMSRVEQPGAR
jgi:hypothetical protein